MKVWRHYSPSRDLWQFRVEVDGRFTRLEICYNEFEAQQREAYRQAIELAYPTIWR